MATLVAGTPTTIASWARVIAQALEACDIDSQRLFADAGIDLEQARDPNTRFPSRDMARVWELAVERSADPCFALRLPEFVHPSMYNALSMALVSSATLREAAERAVRYHRLASDAAELRIEEQRGKVAVIYEVPERLEPVAPEALEGFIVTSVALMRGIGGAGLSPSEVCFQHPAKPGLERYEAFFQSPVRFAASRTCLVYRSADLDKECLHANPELALELEQWMGKYLARYDDDSLSGRVQRCLCEMLPGGAVSQQQVASQLHVSPRALQRRLQQENTTFKTILDDTRHRMALQYIGEPQISITELTFLLGFTDQSNFTRAFRRWTGLPPRQYRAEHFAT